MILDYREKNLVILEGVGEFEKWVSTGPNEPFFVMETAVVRGFFSKINILEDNLLSQKCISQ